MSADLGVTGGVGGVAARYADMRVAAAVLTQEGGALDELGRTALRLLDVEDLLASAVLCPRGAAAAQIALLDAIAGPDGLVVAAAGVRLTGERLEAAADLYQRREEAIADLLVWRRELVGRTIGNAVGTVPPVLLVAGAVLTGGAMALPPVRNGVLVGAEEILEEHPGLTDEAAGHVPGVISGLASAAPGVAVGYTLRTGQSVHPETVAEAVGLVTPFLAVGRGRAAPVSPAAVGAGSSATRAPRGITDLMAGVHERGRESRAVPGLKIGRAHV